MHRRKPASAKLMSAYLDATEFISNNFHAIKNNCHGFWKALCECFFLWLFSSSPVLLNILLAVYKSNQPDILKNIISVWNEIFAPGDALIYSAAFIAPVFFTNILFNNKGTTQPMYYFTFIVSSIVLIASIGMYCFVKTNYAGPVSNDVMVGISKLIYMASIVLWFFSVWQRNSLDGFDLQRKQKMDEDKLKSQLKGFNGGEDNA